MMKLFQENVRKVLDFNNTRLSLNILTRPYNKIGKSKCYFLNLSQTAKRINECRVGIWRIYGLKGFHEKTKIELSLGYLCENNV